MNAATSSLTERLLQAFPSGSFCLPAMLELASIEETDAVPTAAVECCARPRLLLNPQWINEHAATTEKLVMLTLHELHHVVLGHTHYQMLIRSGNTCIVNPGAVGQARGDRRGAAHWAILDLNAGKCEHQETEYQTSVVIAQTQINDPELPYLSNILTKK